VSASQGIGGVNRRVTSLAEKSIVGSTVPTRPFRYTAIACSCRFAPNSDCGVLSCTHHTRTKFQNQYQKGSYSVGLVTGEGIQ